MEPVLIEKYCEMLKSYPTDCSVDRILEDPNLRSEFLTRVRTAQVHETEYEILHGLHNLRKKSKLPRRTDLAA